MRKLVSALVLVLGALLLAGCGGDDAGHADYPSGSVRLRQNVPTPYQDYTLTAINLDGSKGIVVISPPSGGHTNVPVEKGRSVTAEGLKFEVVDVVEADDGEEAPGARGGLVVILPRG